MMALRELKKKALSGKRVNDNEGRGNSRSAYPEIHSCVIKRRCFSCRGFCPQCTSVLHATFHILYARQCCTLLL